MLTEQRKQLLIECLRKDGRIVAKEMSDRLGLSEDTIRRDLRELAAEGLLTRVHGGALPASPTVANLQARRSMSSDEKQRLGKRAVSVISKGQTVFVDGGTTNLELVRHLPLDIEATVVTHSPTIAAALEPHLGIVVILIGGVIYRHSMVSVGAAAREALERIRFDICFIGLTGLHLKEGATTGDYEEASIKRTVIDRSADVFSLVTSEKINAVSPHQICPANALTTVVLPQGVDLKEFGKPPFDVIRA